MSRIRITEVGMRDGLQNEKIHLTQKELLNFARRLSESGIKNLEAGSFVSPKWVPQMSGSGALFSQLIKEQQKGKFNSQVKLIALTPNRIGLDNAISCGVKDIAIFGAASKSFSLKNINCTPKQSLENFQEIVNVSKKKKMKVRAYVSTAFACPYEGKVSIKKVMNMIEAFYDMNVSEISIGDTIGAAGPKQVKILLNEIKKSIGLKKIAMHFHDTRGTALANILMSLELGVKSFDSSIGGLGGCPYADGASGNVATEDVVYMLDSMGLKTGVNLEKLLSVTTWLTKLLNKQLPAKVYRAGAKKFF